MTFWIILSYYGEKLPVNDFWEFSWADQLKFVIVSETLILLFCQFVGESSWQTGISSMAVRFVGQKQECRWFVAKIPYSSFTKGTVWFLFCSNSSVYIHFCTHTCVPTFREFPHYIEGFTSLS